MIVSVTKEESRAFRTFFMLREFASDANIDALKQISSYIARTTDESYDVDKMYECNKFNVGENEICYILSITDGRKILFSDKFDFLIYKYNADNKTAMVTSVYERNPGDLSTTSIYSEVSDLDGGKYAVTFRPDDLSDNSLKYGTINYYSGDEVSWVCEVSKNKNGSKFFDVLAKDNDIYPFAEKSFFDLKPDNDISLDILDGYIANSLKIIDLLFHNVNVIKNSSSKKVLKK